MKKLPAQIAVLLAVVLLFAAFNGSIYAMLTSRLSTNFGGSTTGGQLDVAQYLPHEPDSDLVRLGQNYTFGDNHPLSEAHPLPILDGAAALVPVYASVVENLYPKGSVTYEGGTFSADNEYGENFAADSRMQYNNTVRGYRAVVDGTVDILFCAAPSHGQKQYAAEAGVELTYIPVGREAFVFFVHRDNPVTDLTTDQIRAIYAGEIRNWAEVGGVRRPINPVTRLEGSGSQSAMDSFMGDTPYGIKSPLSIFGGSIGFSFRYYLADMVANSQVKLLSVNGTYPDKEAIRAGAYPITAQFYAIYRTDNANPNVPKLIDWLLTEEGQRLIEASGYVSIG